MKQATRSKNTPTFYSKIFEFDVTCEHCHKKEVLKTTLPLQKVVRKVCRGCGKEYKVDISNLKDKRFDKFSYWLECETR